MKREKQRQVSCVAGSSGSIVVALVLERSWQRQGEKQQNKRGLRQSAQKQAGHIAQSDAGR